MKRQFQPSLRDLSVMPSDPALKRRAIFNCPYWTTLNHVLNVNFDLNMKRPLLFSLLLFACCSVITAADIKGKVVSYGLFKVSGKDEIVKSPQTPSGITRIPAGTPILTMSTNRVPAKIGICFGMWFEITNVPAPDGEVEVTKIARHPTITKSDGTTSKGFTSVEKQWVKDGRVTGWTGYSLDHDYELATGDWEFEMQVKGISVCNQKFTVFKE